MMKATRFALRFTLRFAITAAIAVAVLAPAIAHACGACAEDKIAATYDHATIEHAAARGDVVVFCAVTGPLAVQRLKDAAQRAHGVNARSVRVSAQPQALSFAVDPRRQSPQAAIEAIQLSLPKGTRLTTLRLVRAGSG